MTAPGKLTGTPTAARSTVPSMQATVLISGPSGSGKTTLAHKVGLKFGMPVLHLDDYFIRGAKAFVDCAGARVRTFERPALYDGARLAADVGAQRHGCVVEGFCLFTYPEITVLNGFRFYLDVPFGECLARRNARKPQRPSDRSFRIVGESETAAFVLPQRNLPGIHVLDGTRGIEELAAAIASAAGRAAA